MKMRNFLKILTVAALSLVMLCASFTVIAAEQTAEELIGSWMEQGENSHNSYPEDVGGIFVTVSYNAAEKKETYTYHVSLVGRTAEREAAIKEMVTDPENIRFTDAKYSYAQLEKVMNEITATMSVDGINVNSVGIMEDVNYVEVGTDGDVDALAKALEAKYGEMAKAAFASVPNMLDTSLVINEVGAVLMPSPVPTVGAEEKNDGMLAYAVILLAVSLICLSGAGFVRSRAKRLAHGAEETENTVDRKAAEQKIRDSAEEPSKEVLENLRKEMLK